MNRRFIKIIIVIFVAILAGTLGYLSLINQQAPPSEISQPQRLRLPEEKAPTRSKTTIENINTSKNTDSCELLSNASFQSLEQHGVGLAPKGEEAIGYWRIQFKKVKTPSGHNQPIFRWGHSDMIESGTYTCKDNVLQVKLFRRNITAEYDPEKDILTWDGIQYKRIK